MNWSLYVGKISGIKLFIHWTFAFFIAWIIMSNIQAGESSTSIFYMLAFIFSVFVCITLHEFGHALMAKRFNYKTKDITLLPIGGMARMEEIPENPKHELAVAIAGPMVNIVIAAILYPFVYWWGNMPENLMPNFSSPDTFLFNLFYTNIFLVVFNLLPAFPMDGGRVFRALLSMKITRVKATNIAARTGQVISIGFFLMGLFVSPFLAIIGIFIFLMAHAESEYVKSKSILHDYCVRDVVMRKYFSLNAMDSILNAVKLLLDVQATDFLVVDDNDHVIGTINRDRIVKALAERGKDDIVAKAMNTNLVFLTPEMPLDKAFSLFERTDSSSIFPVIQDKQIIGIVDMSNIVEFIMIKAAAEKSPVHLHKEDVDMAPKMASVFF